MSDSIHKKLECIKVPSPSIIEIFESVQNEDIISLEKIPIEADENMVEEKIGDSNKRVNDKFESKFSTVRGASTQ